MRTGISQSLLLPMAALIVMLGMGCPLLFPVVTVTPSNPTIEAGGTVSLTADSTSPRDTAFTWRSDAPAVATVNANGVVTGVAVGTATITATGNSTGAEGSVEVTVTPSGGDDFENASVARGGQLYDEWWPVTDAAEPDTDHPLWATRPDLVSNTRTGATTWRCKECHGWDYKGVDGAYGSGSHRTGFPGIIDAADVTLRTKSATEVFAEVKTAHGYGDVLSDADIWDVTKFVLQGQLDTDTIIDTEGAFIGDPAAGQALFAVCAACHGEDGLAMPPGADPGHDEFPGLVSNENPWEFQHKVSFGQPGTVMPPQVANLTVAQIGNLGAYAQTLPAEPPDFVRGGQLYDEWWAVVGAAEPTEDHPLWATRPDQASNTRIGAITWRCKECHGWDYKGVDGAYANGSHRTGFPGIFNTEDVTLRTKSATDVFDVIKTGHGYGDVLSDADIWDLTEFVLTGQLDTDNIIDAERAFTGDPAAGQTHFAVCAACHGQDGLTPPPGAAAGFSDFPGFLADDNPEEFQHKVSFGQPGTIMPPQAENLSVPEIGDLGAYAQTLPTE